MPGKLKISFIIHGKAIGRKRLIHEVGELLKNEFDLNFRITDRQTNAMEIGLEEISKGADILVAVGGDGTVHEVANAIMNSGKNDHLILGILPYGRGNDFVKSLKISKDLNLFKKALMERSIIPVDLGLIRFTGLEEKQQTRYFINVADIGIGGVATQLVRNSSKRLGANFTYISAIVRSFFRFRHQQVQMSFDRQEYSGEILSICLANGRYFGSGLCIAPEANMDDGKAELVVIGRVSLWDFFKKLPLLRKGEIIAHPEISYFKCQSCTINADQPTPIDMDGEFVGFTPLGMEMIPKAIKILLPLR